MNRRHPVIAAGVLSAALLLYCVSFGPVAYVWAKAGDLGFVPQWLDDGLEVVFHPHIRCMYHSESYFSYVFWFIQRAIGPLAFTWEDFRQAQDGL